MKQNDLPAKLRRSKQNREQYQKRKRSVQAMKEWSETSKKQRMSQNTCMRCGQFMPRSGMCKCNDRQAVE